MRIDDGVTARRKSESSANGSRQEIRKTRIDLLQCGVSGTADGAGSESSDGFVDGNDAADFRRVLALSTQQLKLRIDHFDARGPEPVYFRFAVKHEELSRLEPALKIAAVEKLARQRAGIVLYEKVIDGVASTHAANGLAAGNTNLQREDIIGANVFDL